MKKLEDISNLSDAISTIGDYNYQIPLTQKLDNHVGDFCEINLLEIVLWKTNRYPEIKQDLIDDINNLREDYQEQKAKELLTKLLGLKGFDLPMASTVLRFAVPDKLQIIDQHVYRFITDNDFLKIPHNIEKKIKLYFEYIQKLKHICQEKQIEFKTADRILYQLDKKYNKDIPLKNY